MRTIHKPFEVTRDERLLPTVRWINQSAFQLIISRTFEKSKASLDGSVFHRFSEHLRAMPSFP